MSQVIIEKQGNAGWRLSCVQRVSRTPREIFSFFADAYNLERITPSFLNFRVLAVSTQPLSVGTTLDYRLRLHRVPVFWRTVIQEWNPPHHFSDVQKIGPFKTWHHRHKFISVLGGTELHDVVTFDLYCRRLSETPLLGWVQRDVRRIFDFRRARIAELFGPIEAP